MLKEDVVGVMLALLKHVIALRDFEGRRAVVKLLNKCRVKVDF